MPFSWVLLHLGSAQTARSYCLVQLYNLLLKALTALIGMSCHPQLTHTGSPAMSSVPFGIIKKIIFARNVSVFTLLP